MNTIHPTAIVEPKSYIGAYTRIWHFAHEGLAWVSFD